MADFNLKPLEDRILVQASEGEQTTASGLVIPDTAKEKPQEGTVLAVGPGRWNEDGDSASPSTSRRATRSSTPSTAAPRSRSRRRVPDPVGPRRPGRRRK